MHPMRSTNAASVRSLYWGQTERQETSKNVTKVVSSRAVGSEGVGRPSRPATRGRGQDLHLLHPTPVPPTQQRGHQASDERALRRRRSTRIPTIEGARDPPARAAPARRPRLTAPPRGSPRPRRSREQGRGRWRRARARAGGARRAGCTARVQPRWKGVRTERAKPGAPSTPTPWSGSRTPSCASCPG